MNEEGAFRISTKDMHGRLPLYVTEGTWILTDNVSKDVVAVPKYFIELLHERKDCFLIEAASPGSPHSEWSKKVTFDVWKFWMDVWSVGELVVA